ncbi:MAG: hypothetical protein JXQ89_17860 [Pelagimonas sp.]|jgi:hypothetical protein
MTNTTIASCCYCGARTALVLTPDRHELCCASCGAPLHNMKRLKEDAEHPSGKVKTKKLKKTKAAKVGYGKPSKVKKKKKSKSFTKSLFGEAFDLIEDIFD